jgi:hypothetical protein
MEEALRRVAGNSAADAFYSLMYIGLWREARGEEDAAKAGAYTRSPHSSTGGPSGHTAHVRAQIEHLRDTSTG